MSIYYVAVREILICTIHIKLFDSKSSNNYLHLNVRVFCSNICNIHAVF